MLVQYQNALARESKNVSPFMVNGPDQLDPKMMTIEAPKTKEQLEMERQQHGLQPSQSVKVMPTQIAADAPMQEHLKYSESMSTLRKLRDAEEETKHRPASSIFKKGTAEFIQRKIMSKQGNRNQQYDTGDFQKSQLKRFNSGAHGDGQ